MNYLLPQFNPYTYNKYFNQILTQNNLKGMNFVHDFGYSFHLFSSLLKKREREKDNELVKIVTKIHAFQTGPYLTPSLTHLICKPREKGEELRNIQMQV